MDVVHGAPGELPTPFPGVLGSYAVRAFGSVPDDLGLDLQEPAGVDVVTALLGACLIDDRGRPAPHRVVREAPVGDRIVAVMALAAAIDDRPFALELRCPAAACLEGIEITVTWDEIHEVAARAVPEPVEVVTGRARYRVRRATAVDQERWRPVGAWSPTAREVVASLVVEGPAARLTEPQVAAIESALDDADPLVCFAVDVRCPACGLVARQEPSLVAAAMAVFRRAQAALLEDVHELARGYGWSEPQILAIPPWRRARYRARLMGAG